MPRHFKKKKQSKVDEALSIAKRNKKQLATVVDIVSNDTALSATFNATPNVVYLQPNGTGLKTRITSIRVKGIITRAVASTLADNWRMDIVLDREPDGVEATPLLVYGTATPSLGHYKNGLLKSRFKILRTMTDIFGENAAWKSGSVIDWYIKLNLIAVSKVADSFAQANIQKNAIYVIFWTTATANQPIATLRTRITSMDIQQI